MKCTVYGNIEDILIASSYWDQPNQMRMKKQMWQVFSLSVVYYVHLTLVSKIIIIWQKNKVWIRAK